MIENNGCPASDAEWYFREDPERDRFNDIFFGLCKKYHVNWSTADAKERAFIAEIARVSYERDRAIRFGYPLSDIKPAFAA